MPIYPGLYKTFSAEWSHTWKFQAAHSRENSVSPWLVATVVCDGLQLPSVPARQLSTMYAEPANSSVVCSPGDPEQGQWSVSTCHAHAWIPLIHESTQHVERVNNLGWSHIKQGPHLNSYLVISRDKMQNKHLLSSWRLHT